MTSVLVTNRLNALISASLINFYEDDLTEAETHLSMFVCEKKYYFRIDHPFTRHYLHFQYRLTYSLTDPVA